MRVPREGCYCRDGFVRNSAGRCVKLEECGCRLPKNRGIIAVGSSVISRDCSKRYTCSGPQQSVSVQNLKRCSPNAQCRGDKKGQPRCFCKSGFNGDGYNCKPVEGLTTPSPNPCNVNGVCGRGAVCRNNRGKAVCYCKNQIVPASQTCCNREFRTL